MILGFCDEPTKIDLLTFVLRGYVNLSKIDLSHSNNIYDEPFAR